MEVRKACLIIGIALLFSIPAKAQVVASTHQNAISWTAAAPVTGVTIAGYNIFKSTTSGKEAPPALNGTTPITGLSYVDSNVAVGQTNFYVVQTVSTTGNSSVPSNEVSATTPPNPNPPTITITSVSINNVSGQDRLQVNWTAPNNDATAFTIFGGQGQVLKQASQTTANGVYSYAILIPVQSGVISICDSKGCVSQSFTGI